MEDAKAVFGRRLRELRTERGLTQDQLAAAAGEMSRVYLGALERGERSAGIETLQRLGLGLGVEPAELLRGVSAGIKRNTGRSRGPSAAERLARVVLALAENADARSIRKFERIAKVYFTER